MSVYKRNIFFFIRASIFFFFLTLSNLLTAQENEISKQTDTTSLQHALRKGHFEAHFRLYYMSTNNQRPLTDYYALAFGGGVKYETGKFKNFQVGIGGFFIWNLTSSNLAIPDSLTGIKNRYEIGQFDMENPENKNDMDRLEDFYLKYSLKKSS